MSKQMKFQKIAVLVLLIACVICFIYALSFMTGVFNLLYKLNTDKGKPMVEGANLFYELQPYNKILLTLSIVFIGCALLSYFVQMDKRRRYYIGNFIVVAIDTLVYVGSTIWLFISLTKVKNTYVNTIDWPKVEFLCDIYDIPYTESTLWFDLGYVAYSILLLATALFVANLIWKVVLMRREDELLASTHIEEAVL